MKKAIRIFPILFLLINMCFVGCSESTPSIPLGTYTFTNEDGSISEIVLEKDTVCFKNADFSYAEEIFVIRNMLSEIQEAENEGRNLTQEEKDELNLHYKDLAEFSNYESKPVNYFTEYFEGDQSIQLYTLDENGDEILGLQATYYLKDKTLGFADDYFTLGNQE